MRELQEYRHLRDDVIRRAQQPTLEGLSEDLDELRQILLDLRAEVAESSQGARMQLRDIMAEEVSAFEQSVRRLESQQRVTLATIEERLTTFKQEITFSSAILIALVVIAILATLIRG